MYRFTDLGYSNVKMNCLEVLFNYDSQGGACSTRHTVGLITGYMHDHKITKYDMYRATMHALGHLFGANKESVSDPMCKINSAQTPGFYNRNNMDPFHFTGIGLRPNSMRYSPCAKIGITKFLSSANANCFQSDERPVAVCGNGSGKLLLQNVSSKYTHIYPLCSISISFSILLNLTLSIFQGKSRKVKSVIADFRGNVTY